MSTNRSAFRRNDAFHLKVAASRMSFSNPFVDLSHWRLFHVSSFYGNNDGLH